ncbi:MAG: tetratricopeptide repeat protein [Bryobacteraceae bacterium]
MKKQKRAELKPSPAGAATIARAPWRPQAWHYLLAALAALFIALEAYGPALGGPLVFDDSYLPFADGSIDRIPLRQMLTGLRPVLMLSYLLNYRLSGYDTYSYHLVNVLLHVVNSVLVFHIAGQLLRRLEGDVAKKLLLASFCAGLFLLHPLQTESVAYIASRSEALSIFFAYASLAVLLGQREEGVGWLRSVAVLILFGLACLTKEHTAVLPAVFLLTDYYWFADFNLVRIRKNWRLYVPTVVGAAAGVVFVLRVLKGADTAGFGLKDLPWYEYFFTQWRAIWVYLRMFVLPFGQNADHDFAISHTPWDQGAFIGLLGLLALAVLAFLYRRRYPLASYGFFMFLILIAPTSSVVPIRDLMVERRFYLPSLGMVLVVADACRHWRVPVKTLATAAAIVLALCAVLTWQRNHVWSSVEALWKDVIAKSPNKARPHSQLALAIYQRGDCAGSLPDFEKAIRIDPEEHRALIDYGLALDCLGRLDDARHAFERAAARKSAYAYALVGMIYGKQGNREAAMRAIETSLKMEPTNDITYLYRGNLHVMANEMDKAADDFRTALRINPTNPAAGRALQRIGSQSTAP